ncbi:hypothetical protein HK104_007904 [Borealophlyctis nickersoniae]|nr:hypothetical protein HK104_007904 [Borealophlyctis nickersoniae]
MAFDFDPSVYLITDRSLLPPGRSLLATVRDAIAGGATLVQLREKNADTRTFTALARSILEVCRAASVPLLINDRIDVALAVDADGVHVGQDDMPIDVARRLLGPHKILGLTVENVQQAVNAVESGLVDYIGTAACFETATKKHKDGFKALGTAGVREILAAVRDWPIPVVTIGGIGLGNVEQVLTETVVPAGPDGRPERRLAGIAVVSAIIAQPDAQGATRALASKIRTHINTVVDLEKLVSVRPPNVQYLVDKVADALTRIRTQKPLVHNITNYVVMNDTANTILHLGGLPVMAHGINEVADITAISQALVINIGTLSEAWIESMHTAAKKATASNVPIILDPVGAGATAFRKYTCVDLLHSHPIRILKGNAGEIAAIAGTESVVAMRGVESVGTLSDPGNVVKSLSSHLAEHHKKQMCVAISGAVDYVSDGMRVVECHNGNEWLGTLTGTGCTTSALAGCFAAVEEDPVVAAVGGIVCLGIAAEIACRKRRKDGSKIVDGPASFKVALYDALYALDADQVKRYANVVVA